jgi:catechol 2,3-dioxygenase-like lactoylglutathione lyase family enzyme
VRGAHLWALITLLLSGQALAQTASPPANGLIGPVLFVSDVARSVRFYEALGFRVGTQMGSPQRHETILTFGGDPRSPGIILLSDQTATTPAVIDHGHGYDRTVLRIGDLAGVSARLQAAGFAATPIHDVAMGYRMMLASDPDGYKLEMVEAHSRP